MKKPAQWPVSLGLPSCSGEAGSKRNNEHGAEALNPNVLRLSGLTSAPRSRSTMLVRADVEKMAGTRSGKMPPLRRGEHPTAGEAGEHIVGSSPHARGTRCGGQLEHEHARFIPACAGNAARQPTEVSLQTVHPRMRGERMDMCNPQSRSSGSSPHARGTPTREAGNRLCIRFIPACAGNAPENQGHLSRVPVHPRMRGERLLGAADRPAGARFIPACAGNAARLPRVDR